MGPPKALKGAIGIVETRGFVSLIEAVDAMLKASNEEILESITRIR